MLEEGKKAPAFKGIDQDGKTVSLADYKGKKLVLYFYPKDNTPTCTVQACNIRDHFSGLKKKGIHIIGISADDTDSHKKFEEKHQLPFTILADTGRTIIDQFGVWGEKQLYGKKYMGLLRTTFLINEKGVIVKVIAKPKSKQHAEEIIEAWQSIDQ